MADSWKNSKKRKVCMDKQTISLLTEYAKAVNEKMIEIIGTLTMEEWDRPLGGYFKSVHELCSHQFITDFNWIKRFFVLRDFAAAKDAFFVPVLHHRDIIFSEKDGKDEYLSKRPELDKKISGFCAELTAGDFGMVLKYTDPFGNYREKNAGGALLHMLNHGTHHRGMISLYLEIMGKPNDFNSLIAYVPA
jgi:uncharacterized damage-inducible protein DinB